MDSQEGDVPGCEATATGSPNSTSNPPTATDYPGSGFRGCELLVEDVIELRNPAFITHEVTHGI